MKTALITGASSGIGAACAEEFAGAGYGLMLCCDKQTQKLKSLTQHLSSSCGVFVKCACGDVSDAGFVDRMCGEALSFFGHIDVLINNAGISQVGLLSELPPKDWERILSVNLTGPYLFCRALIPSMVHRKSGRILNISSVWGSAGASCEAAYAASKGGLDALTKSLGKELSPSGIAVNAIACGLIDTEMNAQLSEKERADLLSAIPAGRMGSAKEAARLALLITYASPYLTGQVIPFDGGWI